jgi:predicted nucleic acid-binding protein
MSNLFHIPSLKGLTIYDVTYLYYALRNKPILVTDDEKLVEKAKQLLETVSTGELVQK